MESQVQYSNGCDDFGSSSIIEFTSSTAHPAPFKSNQHGFCVATASTAALFFFRLCIQ